MVRKMSIPIYYINLASRRDRAHFFLEQFSGTNLTPERVEATNWESVEERHFVPKEVAACWLSHQAAYLKLIQSGSSHAVIMEDDAVITRSTLRFLYNLQSADLNQLDIFQFGYLTHKWRIDFPTYDPSPFNILSLRNYTGNWIARLDNVHRTWLRATRFLLRHHPLAYFANKDNLLVNAQIRRSNNFLERELLLRQKYGIKHPLIYHSIEAGAHAYVISKFCAEKLLRFNRPVFLPADLALMAIGRSQNFVVVRTSRSLCNQSDSPSSITNRSLLRRN